MFNQRFLLAEFWLCWVGTNVLPFSILFSNNVQALVFLSPLFAPCLCFVCARCVRFIPQLAKVGMISLAFWPVLLMVLLFVRNRFQI